MKIACKKRKCNKQQQQQQKSAVEKYQKNATKKK